jgi:ubiquinone biosynthesis protein
MLYPELDLWDTAKPFLERWMREQLGPRAALRALRRELPKWLPLVPELPALSYELLRRLQNPPDTVGVEDLERLRVEVRAGQRRMFYAVLGGTLILGALVAAILSGETATVFNDRVAPWVLGVPGGALLLAARPRKKS